MPQAIEWPFVQYIYQHKNWPNFTWNDATINAIFGEVRNLQGKITGQMAAPGFSSKEEVALGFHKLFASSLLCYLFGSHKGHISAILSGKREITLKMAQKLKNYFSIPAEVFLRGV